MRFLFKIEPLVRNVFLALIVLYYSQGVLIAEGTSLTQGILLAILGISGYYFVKVMLLTKRPALVNAWTALLLLNVLSYVFTYSFINHKVSSEYLKAILVVLLPFYPIFYLAIKKEINLKHFVYFFIISLPISILHFNNEQAALLDATMLDDVVNNAAYSFVGLIPFVFLIRKRLPAYISLVIISYFIIQGAKRGALVVGAVGLLMYAYYQLRTVPKNKRFRAYALVISGFFVLGYYINIYYSDHLFLQQRLDEMSEGHSSGRDIIYASIFNNWYYSDNIFKMVFGYGFKGSKLLSSTGNSAHNDWLELLANNGLVGVGVYLFLFYSLIKSTFNRAWSKNKQLILLSCTVIWFTTTLFSMGFNAASFTGMFMLIAYLVGSSDKNLI